MAAFSSSSSSYQQQQHHPFHQLLIDSSDLISAIDYKMSEDPNFSHYFYPTHDDTLHCLDQTSTKVNNDEGTCVFSLTNKNSMDSSSVLTDHNYYDHHHHQQLILTKNPKKRRNYSKQGSSLNSAQSKDMREVMMKGKKQKKMKGCEEKKSCKEGKKEAPAGYIHVRARRGQATDSHSLAERVRRERISERMKLLQAIVPGCDKVTGKALMLDEIINYVQSLQNQVEFLSMKLASVNPISYDFGMDLESLMVRPPAADHQNLSSLQPSPLMQSCSPATANPYDPLLDNSLLFQQAQISNVALPQDNREVLWGVEDQRQKTINQSEISSSSLFSFH